MGIDENNRASLQISVHSSFFEGTHGFLQYHFFPGLTMQAMRPLPWFRGPKLGPFEFRDETQRNITFLEHVGGGVHAEVFRVTIDGSIYALKVVCYIVSHWALRAFGVVEVLLTWQ